MAQELRKNENSPGVIITSPAFRALETAIIFAEEFKVDPGKIIMEQQNLLQNEFPYSSGISSHCQVRMIIHVTLFGHNPSFTEIARYFMQRWMLILCQKVV